MSVTANGDGMNQGCLQPASITAPAAPQLTLSLLVSPMIDHNRPEPTGSVVFARFHSLWLR